MRLCRFGIWLLACGLACTHALRVFVLPHSHCDAGYKKTFEGYYLTEVSRTLTTVVTELSKDTSLRFLWSETSFLERWWTDHPELQDSFCKLVTTGQIEIVNGGWVMHDEAITNINDQTLQLSAGHTQLKQLLSSFDRVHYGWQIDPFGPTATSPTFAAMSGYSAVVHNRIPNEIKAELSDRQQLQFVWRGSSSLDANTTETFYHVLSDHYNSPDGFDWEEKNATPVTDENVQEFANGYVKACLDRARKYQGDILLIPFGTDFEFQNASQQFNNMSQIVNYINSHPSQFKDDNNQPITLQYTTLTEYFTELNKQKLSFPVLTGSHFLPYNSWSGYYSGYSWLKAEASRASQMIAATNMITTMAKWEGWDKNNAWWPSILNATRQVAIMQHHDSLPGTGFDLLHADCQNRLSSSMRTSFTAMAHAVSYLVSSRRQHVRPKTAQLEPRQHQRHMHHAVVGDRGQSARLDTKEIWDLTSLSMGQRLDLAVINALGWARTEIVSVVVARNDIVVRGVDESGDLVALQSQVHENPSDLTYTLSFVPTVPAMGFTTVQLETCGLEHFTSSSPYTDDTRPPSPPCATLAKSLDSETLVANGISNSRLKVFFSDSTCSVSRIDLHTDNTTTTLPFTVSFVSYISPNDTLYAFQPDQEGKQMAPTQCTIQGSSGSLSSDVWISHGNGNAMHITLLNQVGSDAFDGLEGLGFRISFFTQNLQPYENRAVVMGSSCQQHSTSSDQSTMVYTENGYEDVEYSYSASVGIGNTFRPFVTRLQTTDEATQVVLTALGNSPRAIRSKCGGQFEMLVHRRILRIDNSGVKWADDRRASESDPIHVVLSSGAEQSSSDFREMVTSLGKHVQQKLHTVATVVEDSVTSSRVFEGLATPLPRNVHVHPIAPVPMSAGSDFVVRVEHLFPLADHDLGQAVDLNLNDILSGHNITKATATTVSLSAPLESVSRLTWTTSNVGLFNSSTTPITSGSSRGCILSSNLSFTVFPKQLCSFLVSL